MEKWQRAPSTINPSQNSSQLYLTSANTTLLFVLHISVCLPSRFRFVLGREKCGIDRARAFFRNGRFLIFDIRNSHYVSVVFYSAAQAHDTHPPTHTGLDSSLRLHPRRSHSVYYAFRCNLTPYMLDGIRYKRPLNTESFNTRKRRRRRREVKHFQLLFLKGLVILLLAAIKKILIAVALCARYDILNLAVTYRL